MYRGYNEHEGYIYIVKGCTYICNVYCIYIYTVVEFGANYWRGQDVKNLKSIKVK